jgi:hypothetical protein
MRPHYGTSERTKALFKRGTPGAKRFLNNNNNNNSNNNNFTSVTNDGK